MSLTQGATSQPTTYTQFIRKIGLVVYAPSTPTAAHSKSVGVSDEGSSTVQATATAPGGSTTGGTTKQNGLDLSEMRIRFHVEGICFPDKPKTAVIRVYNLKKDTQNKIKAEYQAVTLQAGYRDGAYGIIFTGTIMRFRTGRENEVDTFLEIMAADADMMNHVFVNTAKAAGSQIMAKAQAAADAAQTAGAIKSADLSALSSTGGIVPTGRGQVLSGLAIAQLNDVAATTNTSWFIEDGVLKFVSNTGYLPGKAVVLNSKSGMIGIPEATTNGVEVTALLNPNLKIGAKIQIDNASINQTQLNSPLGFPSFTDFAFFASTDNDGFYKIIVATHLGDTRGNEWYSRLVCLKLDASAPPGSSALSY